MLQRVWACAALPPRGLRYASGAAAARPPPPPPPSGGAAAAAAAARARDAAPLPGRGAAAMRARRGDPPFREVWRKFALLVHPDLFARWPALREANAEALATLQGVLAEAKSAEGRCTTSAPRPRTVATAFFLRTPVDGAFTRVPLTLRIPGADCRNVLGAAFAQLFKAAGLPDRFHWGADYWQSTYLPPKEEEEEKT
jgi:hypothetical protein